MAVAGVAREQQQDASDARLAVGVAATCATGLAVFVLLPSTGGDQWQPPLGLLWVLGAVAWVLLGPLAAGLAGWASLVALWARGDVLTTRVRRLHLVALLLVAAYAVGLATAWSAGALAWFSD